MNEAELIKYFNNMIKTNSNMSSAVAAIKTLLEYIRQEQFSTLTELREKLIKAIDTLTKTDASAISIKSGCEMLFRFITLSADLDAGMEKCKELLLGNGEIFLSKASEARSKIAKMAYAWIPNGANILTHSRSRVVAEILKEAYKKNGSFNVFISESCPDKSGLEMAEDLRKAGISVTVILDAAIGLIMERVDFVLLGAEGVVESGGIINKVGTSTVGLCAKMYNKPVYVAVESFKFVRFYPLNNSDIPDEFKYSHTLIKSGKDLRFEHPTIDYTQPSLITLLFTDIGILTPSAVSDELVKLYL